MFSRQNRIDTKCLAPMTTLLTVYQSAPPFFFFPRSILHSDDFLENTHNDYHFYRNRGNGARATILVVPAQCSIYIEHVRQLARREIVSSNLSISMDFSVQKLTYFFFGLVGANCKILRDLRGNFPFFILGFILFFTVYTNLYI